jgi:uncharacterized protein YkwD
MPTLRHLLTVLVVAAALAACSATAASAPSASCLPETGWGTNRPDLAQRVVELVNDYRAGKGLSRLTVSAPLTAAAEWKSLHMAGAGYFDHADPAPFARSALQRTKDCGYRGSSWGENIAYGYPTAQSVVSGWIASPGHRANIENPGFTAIGVGAGAKGGRIYWTQSFGNDASGAPTAQAAPRKQAIGGRPARVTREGTRLIARVAFVDLGTGQPVATGRVGCRAEVSGRRLRVLASTFAAGSARCAWRVPNGLPGKELVGIVRLEVGAAAASRVFIRPVR